MFHFIKDAFGCGKYVLARKTRLGTIEYQTYSFTWSTSFKDAFISNYYSNVVEAKIKHNYGRQQNLAYIIEL